MGLFYEELDTDAGNELDIGELTVRIQDPTVAAYSGRAGVDAALAL